MLYHKKTKHYIGVQVKTGTAKEVTESTGWGKVTLNCQRNDGAVGGKYQHFVIIGIIFPLDLDKKSVEAERKGFNMVPEKNIDSISVFGSALEFPNEFFEPYPRKMVDNKYGNNRYDFKIDSVERLEIMKANFLQVVREKSLFSKKELWFSVGKDSPNVLTTEMRGIRKF